MPTIGESIRQAAALAIRRGRVCLITSRNGKRWVIPKGWIEPGQTAGETALQEAYEEAGLVGGSRTRADRYVFVRKRRAQLSRHRVRHESYVGGPGMARRLPSAPGSAPRFLRTHRRRRPRRHRARPSCRMPPSTRSLKRNIRFQSRAEVAADKPPPCAALDLGGVLRQFLRSHDRHVHADLHRD